MLDRKGKACSTYTMTPKQNTDGVIPSHVKDTRGWLKRRYPRGTMLVLTDDHRLAEVVGYGRASVNSGFIRVVFEGNTTSTLVSSTRIAHSNVQP